tara:strand:+ start:369 stop:542 length:174 start_codon:yes stop_codon:yes gene_type:complete
MSQQSSHSPASVTFLSPDIKEPVDTLPLDHQPPGVDEEKEKEEEWEPQSLEEALLGE